MPSAIKPLPESMLTQVYIPIWHHNKSRFEVTRDFVRSRQLFWITSDTNRYGLIEKQRKLDGSMPSLWSSLCPLESLFLTRIEHFMDKSYTQQSVKWNYLSISILQRLHRWSLRTDALICLTLYNGCNYLSMLRLKLIHVSKKAPCLLN